jgi:secondary thiamine-phosphate synthase enzyme
MEIHMMQQRIVTLKPVSRGFHLITDEIIFQCSDILKVSVGIAHIFIQHSSASLTINENADPDVRRDMESHFNELCPEYAPYYLHTCEGGDDMPAHLKASLLGSSLTIPITDGRLAMGIWQGIYLCEHRNHGGARRVVVTVNS